MAEVNAAGGGDTAVARRTPDRGAAEPEVVPWAEGLGASHAGALEPLDVRVLVSTLQAVSSSLELEALIDALMTSAVQHAAAERGCLVLVAVEPRVRARATSEPNGIRVTPDDSPASSQNLPESLLRYVLRSGEQIAIYEDELPEPFSVDGYFEHHHVRSLLCLPIVLRGKVVGALYLENRLVRQHYGARCLAVLNLIASQAAISLENARLYAGIHQAQQRMARAEHASRTGSFSWRPLRQELELSVELSSIFGIDGRPSVGLLRERVHPEDRPFFEAMVDRPARYEGRSWELRLLLPDGTTKHLSVISSLVGPDEYAGTVRDVTEVKRAEEALQRTHTAMTEMTRLASLAEMAAAIAHEVNQPVGAIGLNAATGLRRLSDECPDLPGARVALERIQRDAHRASAVVERLRALFAKNESARSAVDLNDAISEVVALARNRIRAAGATLSLELSAALPPALGDRVQLQQVVMNLLNNGLDAMATSQRKPHVTIRTSLDRRGRLRCEVEDRGVGISEAERERIFEPFYTTKQRGMGIGLSICKNIVASHGGELSVHANRCGEGMTFYFVVPRSESG